MAPVPNELPLAHNASGALLAPRSATTFRAASMRAPTPTLPVLPIPTNAACNCWMVLTWTHGQHVSKFGLEYNKVSDYDNNLYNGNGSYSYDWPTTSSPTT